jgi:dienelactone hydrolase
MAVPRTAALAEQSVEIHLGTLRLVGALSIPPGAAGIVLFAHGKAGSRHSPRNRIVAETLHHAGLGTLLIDLLSPEEEAIDRHNPRLRFDIDLLADRLSGAAAWVSDQAEMKPLRIGCFVASTAAAAALVAAARQPHSVSAIVSRGGRPDLAGSALPLVRAPTLLLVGADDLPVLGLNEFAFEHLGAEKRLDIIPQAGHSFEEPGALEAVAVRARDWFRLYLDTAANPSGGDR